MIVIETDHGKEPMEIVIEESGNVIMIGGAELEFGDTAIIIEEYQPRYGLRYSPSGGQGFTFKSKDLQFDNDAMLGWVEGGKGDNLWAFEDGSKRNLRFDEKELKQLKEDQEIAIKLYQEQLRAYRSDLQHQSKEMQQMTRKQMAEINKELKALKKLQSFDGDAFLFQAENNKAQELLFDAKDLKDSYDFYFEGNGRFSTENVSSRIERELVRDGFIDSGSDYKLEINDQRMKVNGKKVSDEVFEKYKKLYERSTRSKMNKRSNMSINKKDN